MRFSAPAKGLLLISQAAALQIMYRVVYLDAHTNRREYIVNGPDLNEGQVSSVVNAVARSSNNSFGTSRSEAESVLWIYNYFPSIHFNAARQAIGEMQRMVANAG